MVDRFYGLRHNAVVRRDDEDDDIRHLRAARAHGGKRLVARRVDKRNLPAVAWNGVRADVLRNAARFALGYAAVANRIEQRGLAVVDVAHDGDDRRARFELLRRVGFAGRAVREHLFKRLGDAEFEFNAKVGGNEFAGVEIDLLVDRGRHAEQEELLDNLRSRLADLLRKVLYRYGFRSDHRLFDHDGFRPPHGLLDAALWSAAACRRILIPCLRAGRCFTRNRFLILSFFIFRFFCAGIRALVRVVIADALLACGSCCRRRRGGSCRTRSARRLTRHRRTRRIVAALLRALLIPALLRRALLVAALLRRALLITALLRWALLITALLRRALLITLLRRALLITALLRLRATAVVRLADLMRLVSAVGVLARRFRDRLWLGLFRRRGSGFCRFRFRRGNRFHLLCCLGGSLYRLLGGRHGTGFFSLLFVAAAGMRRQILIGIQHLAQALHPLAFFAGLALLHFLFQKLAFGMPHRNKQLANGALRQGKPLQKFSRVLLNSVCRFQEIILCHVRLYPRVFRSSRLFRPRTRV